MTLNQETILKLKTEIEEKANPTSKYYGKLLEWQEFLTNHYGIGLSDDYLFSPGEIFSVIKTEGRHLQMTPSQSLSPEVVIQRLVYSLDCFKDWNYGLLGWNCEHYSRLVATNQALSYQIKDSFMAMFNNGGYHPTAVNIFKEYLEKLGISELVK